MTNAQLHGVIVALAVIVIPNLVFALWLVWLELRDTRKLADYYAEQWEASGRRQRSRDLADW